MSAPSLEEKLDVVGTDIWRYDDSDLDIDPILQRLSQLQIQLKVQRKLHATAELLRYPSFPKQQATRVKHFLKFVFEQTTRGENRHLAFRKLDCNTLKFCGLSYKVKDIIELPQTQFDFLIENVSNFVHRRKLGGTLYRDDIDKMVFKKVYPEDEELHRGFLKAHIDLRPKKRLPKELPQSPRSHPSSDAQRVQPDGQPSMALSLEPEDTTSTITMTDKRRAKNDSLIELPQLLLPYP
ncbi:hypothetical protein K505DRAFT_328792 [Melanomma pulvis-pyrius CBS 109.77]|uniref:Uncharacterized protein n=1 Tax=Melanomma pulvis-pyrius CBS 109.77 TaxID=1314802 RepID=A0A6A6WXL6_9PLEO|nr:hypothetical protein K505DRAFT_328792 [Melanomma pulvis-pyrius CBS 109.77]